MIYKGFKSGIVTRDCDLKIYKCVIENSADYVSFETNKFEDIEKVFHATIDNYIKQCEELGKDPLIKNNLS